MADIQSLLKSYAQKVLAKDIEGFLSLYHEDVVVFDAFDAWRYDGNHQWRLVPTQWFTDLQTHLVDVRFREVTLEGAGPLRLVHGLIDYCHQTEQDKHLANRFTWIIKQTGDHWKIIHEHTSLPINHLTNYFIREMP